MKPKRTSTGEVEICRTCMVGDAASFVSLSSSLEEDAPIANVVEELTAIQMDLKIGLPDRVCQKCVQQLRQFVAFIKKVRHSDRTLRRQLKSGLGPKPVQAVELIASASTSEDVKQQPVDLKEEYTLAEETEVHILEEEYLEFEDDFTMKEEDPEEEEKELDFDVMFDGQNEGGESDTEFIGFDNDSGNNDSKSLEQTKKQKRRTKAEIEQDNIDDKAQLKHDELDEIELETFRIVERTADELVCCGCYQVFSTEEELKEHSAVHASKTSKNSSRPYVCTTCYRRYTNVNGLQIHIKQTKTMKIYECVRCNQKIINPKTRRNHAHNHPQRKVLQSSVLAPIRLQPDYRQGYICCAQACGLAFKTDEDLLEHAHSAHRVNKFNLELPENQDKPFACPVCFKCFTNQDSLRKHQKRVYKSDKLQCTICGLKFITSVALANHETKHRSERAFKCPECPKAFATKGDLKAHSISHQTDRPYVCSVCGAGFQRKGSLINHERIHSDQKAFQCQYCPKAFKIKYALQLHTRTHTGERPYHCNYCEKSFADHTNRQRHEMSHTGIKPHKCRFCEKTFITRRLRAEHERSNHGQSSPSPKKEGQIIHQQSTPDVEIMECSVCGIPFTNLKSLQKHLQQQHMEEDDESD
ncbi:gastrula zinc finger protein XlCGF26.1-like [Uranotaenia lowii]|uniref:gastrula zinc finger protein XlCGF26.1-like n=1 Tax=Uranotaenia lowii TaxID=190385 RepID=UPI00247AA377|nr:gastrula zinc finger protein XlCGF26.1-like [Uranotaenia lowii]